MKRIKRGHATAVIALLIAILAVMQAIDHRNALRCYVSQQAAKYQQAQAFATADEIHDIVWEYTVADLDGQLWRARLDDLFHDIFMGGRRGEQVWAEMENPSGEFSDVYCDGHIEWAIWDTRDDTTLERTWSSSGIEAVHDITLALQALPPEDLRYYRVYMEESSFQFTYADEISAGIYQYRGSHEADVYAKDWLNGEIAPPAWSVWYARWQELQENEGE